MISALLLVVLGVLILVTLLDLKYKAVPSVLLTALIFAVLLLRPQSLIFGVVALVFGLMIKDLIHESNGLDFGKADIKILIVLGLLIVNIENFLIMIMLFLVLQFGYVVAWRIFVSKEKEMPFIPVLLATYIAMIILGGVA